MLKGFDLILVSMNTNNLKEPDLSCYYFHRQSIFYHLEMKFVSAFSAFPFLFEAISKNLNLHCLILICLETLLSICSLHSHNDILLYWYLSELRPIMQTIFKTVAYTQLPSMKIILLLIVYCFRM